MVTVVACMQGATALGYYAVMAHLVAHLRDDVGLLAGTIALVLGLRVAAQYALFLPFGSLVDRIAPRRAGMLACGLRAVAFGLLGVAGDLGTLLAAALALAVGGALLHPSVQSVLAGLPPGSRSRGFGIYVVTGQIAAVAGPPAGLALLVGGFELLAAVGAAAWVVMALMFALLPRTVASGGGAGARPLLRGVADVVRDRAFLRFAVVTAPGTLLATQVVTVVPLGATGAGEATLFFCAGAVGAAGIQPFVARRGRGGRSWVLRAGLLCAGSGYLLVAALPGAADWRMAVLVAAALVNGVGTGLIQTGSFHTIVRCAPEGRVGSAIGVANFVAGAVALAGGLVVGRLFDAGAETAALAGLAALGTVSAVAYRRPAP
ncbi:MFS transporter [Nonomuraea indica]|uniref:MFS transporter n=1 Tax=Nonomuraea indica TaxID=1581193 RepID=UPI0015DEB5C4|nr:MFS transporter [Nonomuraea indica]